MAQQALLLRIGAEKDDDGGYCPIFEDGTLQYVPIHETMPVVNQKTYRKLGLSDYVKPALHEAPAHLDPLFDPVTGIYTYGEGADLKKNQKACAQLRKGDLLVFYATCATYSKGAFNFSSKNQYIIGYFTVRHPIFIYAPNAQKPIFPEKEECVLYFKNWLKEFPGAKYFQKNPMDWILTNDFFQSIDTTKSDAENAVILEKHLQNLAQQSTNVPVSLELMMNAHYYRFVASTQLDESEWYTNFTVIAGDPSGVDS